MFRVLRIEERVRTDKAYLILPAERVLVYVAGLDVIVRETV